MFQELKTRPTTTVMSSSFPPVQKKTQVSFCIQKYSIIITHILC